VRAREAEWKAKEENNYTQDWGADSHPSTLLEDGWDAPVDDKRRAEWSASDSKVSVSNPSITLGWPSVEGGVEVSIEVRSDIAEPESGRSTCRSLMIIVCLSVRDLLSSLCHSTVSTSPGSCTFSGSH
jgi:hypothetical protein